MSFAQDNGYTPVDFTTLMNEIREGINTRFNTNYTEESFVGTNWYKYFYTLVQKVQENEIKTSEIFLKLTQYITLTNENIQRPSVSLPGLIDSFANKGYVASVRKMTELNAGKIAVCIDTDDSADDYADTKLDICTLLSEFTAAGMVFDGTETETITLSNGQSFDFKFYLPDYTPVLIKMTASVSSNNLLVIPDDIEIRQQIFNQIKSRYRLGWDFEPEKYFTTDDAPWASEIDLEWSDDDGLNWYGTVFTAEFDDLFTFDLEDIQVVIS